ncbi:olfactory receptor class A-like protein 1 [Latimeria chalumnae]|uniref:Vomeronasal type-1 receptor n=1 Tax=Latimeria chalumnae TaxID=7897 RepID=H2ZYI9_LATCH|nr:PREDICTED: vomeronasal type-1 receptor 3-like [Latimeria chalumnae]|eukprot:XP_014346519.1 PREDICTED: vomeronasal type-1 receptor 3-like [Latimeria chalumnae]
MDLYNLVKGIIFILTAIVGVSGNLVILVSFYHIALQERKFVTAQVILLNLAWANMIMALTRGVPHSLFIFGLRFLFDDIGCKIVVFASRVSRAMSICLTCLLSCFQCITITKSTLKWLSLKGRMQKYVILIIIGLCVMNMLVCIAAVLFSVSSTNTTNLEYTFNLGYCLVTFPDQLSFQVNGFAIFARDIIFVVLMALASAYILLVLFRHGRQVKGIRSSDRNNVTTAEGQATKTVVTLVTLYVLFFGIDNTIWFYQITVSKEVHSIVSDIRFFFSVCYASICPIVIIMFNPQIRNKLKASSSEQETQVQEISSTQ